MKEIKALQEQEGKSLGELVSDEAARNIEALMAAPHCRVISAHVI